LADESVCKGVDGARERSGRHDYSGDRLAGRRRSSNDDGLLGLLTCRLLLLLLNSVVGQRKFEFRKFFFGQRPVDHDRLGTVLVHVLDLRLALVLLLDRDSGLKKKSMLIIIVTKNNSQK